jgi:hypothetical protein
VREKERESVMIMRNEMNNGDVMMNA